MTAAPSLPSMRPSSGAWSLEQLQHAVKSGFSAHLGFEIESLSERGIVLRLNIGPQHANSVGAIHGGVLAGLADAAGALGTMSLLKSGDQTATTDAQTQFLRPATGAVLYARAEMVRMGRTRAVWTIYITNQQGVVVAQTTQAQAIIQAKEGAADVQSGS